MEETVNTELTDAPEGGYAPDDGFAEAYSEFISSAQRAGSAFESAFPEVDSLPDSVIERITREDVTPVEAYQAYLLELKDIELKQLKKRRENETNTPGSVQGRGAAIRDAFLSEFNLD